MSKNIDAQLMAAGKALVAIGSTLVLINFFYAINFLVATSTKDLETIKTIGMLSFIVILIATIFIIIKIFEAGRALIDASKLEHFNLFEAGNTLMDTSDTNQIKNEWMTNNLSIDTFSNGDPIPHAKTNEEWVKAGKNRQPAWCYYNNDPNNGEMYGKLYNWYAVNDKRGLSPKGYRIPTQNDWDQLMLKFGGEKIAGNALKKTTGWAENGNGTNKSGFSGLPGGYRNGDGTFDKISEYAGWWSSTEGTGIKAWGRYLRSNDSGVNMGCGNKSFGFSVRCVKD